METTTHSQIPHTPGPWNYMTPIAGEHICSIPLSREANARLIAAAPELLDALKLAERYFAAMDITPDFRRSASYTIWQEARVAIAKAEAKP